MMQPLKSGLWIGMPRKRTRWTRWTRWTREISAEEVVFCVAAVVGLGGTLWMIAAIAAGFAARV